MEDNEIADIQIKFQISGLLPGVTLKSAYVVSWVACFRAKYKSKAILANDTDPCNTVTKVWKNREDFPSPWFRLF